LYYSFLAKFIYNVTKDFDSLDQIDNIIIVAPHPDDEIFGLGGLMLFALEKRIHIHIIYLTDGENSGVWHDKLEIGRKRVELSDKVCGAIGIDKSKINRFHIPDGEVPRRGNSGFEEVAEKLRALIDLIQPDVVFTTHFSEYWPYDHVAAYEIAVEAVDGSRTKPQLWFYWIWTWYNISPKGLFNLHIQKMRKIKIDKFYLQKKELMDIYLNAFTPDGKPWSGILPGELLKSLNLPFEIVEKYDGV
jgi:LmbE family N-acetylglucosaminyl deacetylase